MTTLAPVSPTVPPLGFAARVAYLLLVLGTLPTAVSGIGTFLSGQAPMTQWVLMFHVGTSPVFALGLASVAVTWPARMVRYGSFNGFLFWCMLTAGLFVILTGVSPMTPLFGTDGQHQLYLMHRFGGMVFATLLLLHLLTVRPRS